MTKVKSNSKLPNNKHVTDTNIKAKSLLSMLASNYNYEVIVETKIKASISSKPKEVFI